MPEKPPKWRRLQSLKARRRVITKTAKKAEGATLRHAHRFLVKRWDNIRDVRRRIMVWMLGVAAIIVIVGLQMIWFQRSYLHTAPIDGGTYAEAMKGPIETLNPLYATSDAELAANRLIFSSLYNYDSTGHLSPDVATSMQIDDTGKVYSVTLKRNVVWQDGKPLTAKDVAFTVGLMKDTATRSAKNAEWKDFEVEVVDDYQIRFTIPAPLAIFPQALTFSIMPEHILKDIDPRMVRQNAFSTSPVGSGPFSFRLTQSIGGKEGRKVIHLAANTAYYDHKPRVNRFQLHVYAHSDDIATALRTGEVGAAAAISGDVARGVDRQRYDVMSKPINSGVYALINTTQPLTKEQPVRAALQMATNTDDIRKQLYGNPPALDLPLVAEQVPGTDVPQRPTYSVRGANDLLDAAGWVRNSAGVRVKDNQTLKLHVVTRKNSDYEKALELIAGQWREIGVEVEKQVVDPAAIDQNFTQTVLQPRNYDVLIDEMFIGGDAGTVDVFAYWHSRGRLNFSNYGSIASDDLLVSGRSTTDPSLRSVKYKSFARQWLADVPAIGLYQSTMIYAKNKKLQSITSDEKIVSTAERYADVQYWTAENGNLFKTP